MRENRHIYTVSITRTPPERFPDKKARNLIVSISGVPYVSFTGNAGGTITYRPGSALTDAQVDEIFDMTTTYKLIVTARP